MGQSMEHCVCSKERGDNVFNLAVKHNHCNSVHKLNLDHQVFQ